MKKLILKLTVPLLLGAAGACADSPAPATARPPRQASASTRLAEVRPAEGRVIFEAPATTVGSPESGAEVALPWPALVQKILVIPGDRVAPLAPIAKVIIPELNRAAAELLGAEAQLSLVETRGRALSSLLAEGLVREEQVHDIETRVAELRAQVDQAKVVLAAAGLPPSEARALVDRGYHWLRAPIGGVILDSRLVLGAFSDPSQGSWVRIQGQGAERIEVLLTQPLPIPAELTFRDLAGRRHRVSGVPLSRVESPSTGGERVWLALEAPPPLAPGLRGALEIRAPAEGYWVVPETAVVTRGQRSVVFLWEAEVPRRVPVDVLSTAGGAAVVRGPFETGARVLSDGSQGGADEGES